MLTFTLVLAFALSPLAPAVSPADDPVPVSVRVDGIRENDGQVVVMLFADDGGFPRDVRRAAYSAAAPIEDGVALIRLGDVEPGSYAVVAFHDADGDGRMDTNLLGMPTEGVGVVNWTGRRPRFDDVVAPISGEGAVFEIALRYR
jgi:uncharacterized protein (DUF2141 family)